LIAEKHLEPKVTTNAHHNSRYEKSRSLHEAVTYMPDGKTMAMAFCTFFEIWKMVLDGRNGGGMSSYSAI